MLFYYTVYGRWFDSVGGEWFSDRGGLSAEGFCDGKKRMGRAAEAALATWTEAFSCCMLVHMFSLGLYICHMYFINGDRRFVSGQIGDNWWTTGLHWLAATPVCTNVTDLHFT